MSKSLQHHGLQHAKLLCPSLSPWVCSTSCPWWVGDAIQTTSSSVIPFSSYLQSFKASGFFSNESALHITWSEYCSFTFSISPSNDYSGLISFRINRFDLLAVQWTLKSLIQRHNSKASILQRSGFFMVQFSQPYMAIGKTIASDLCWQKDVSAFLIRCLCVL